MEEEEEKVEELNMEGGEKGFWYVFRDLRWGKEKKKKNLLVNAILVYEWFAR